MDDRYFSSDPAQRQVARDLHATIADLPLVCPHGHVDPRLFSDPDYQFGSPVELLIIPDHYIFRMLYSQGISLESLAVPRQDGGPVEQDHRKIWQTVCDNWYLFRGTPTGIWPGGKIPPDVLACWAKRAVKPSRDNFCTPQNWNASLDDSTSLLVARK